MILDQIVQNTRSELEARKQILSLSKVRALALKRPQPRDLSSALQGKGIKLIAEVKKASPSRGLIRADFDPVNIARLYANNGASAISVLTDKRYFQGSPDYLEMINKELGDSRPPLLRKDFIFDPYQIYESKALGADALLLITAILKPEELNGLLSLSHKLGMKCLVEVHDQAELEVALKSGARIIGINNRDLKTFNTDLNTTVRLRKLIPEDRIVVSESGIKTREDVEMEQNLEVNAVLVGEALTASNDIAARMRELL